MNETEEKILREHVTSLSESVQTRAYLLEKIKKLHVRPKVGEPFSEHEKRQEETTRVYQELRDHSAWLRQVALIRREVLLHMHLDKLEDLGLEYPEVPPI